MSWLEKVLSKKAFITSFLFAVFAGGIIAFTSIGKLEDAEIPVKSAIIMTQYPGASAAEVEKEVTDVLEKAVQKLENIDFVESRSMAGMSEITLTAKSGVNTKDMPQLYDHLRRKINDAKRKLPTGAREPIVIDDFGDVYGIFLAISADGFTYQELDHYVEILKREILDIDDIKRVDVYGDQIETVEIRFSNEKFAQLGINPMLIVQALNENAGVVNPGDVVIGTERIRLNVGTKFSSIQEIADQMIQIPKEGAFRLGDVALVERSFYEPKMSGFKFNGQQAMGLAIAMESKVNVIEVGEKFDVRLNQLKKDLPIGIEVHKVFFQPERVDQAIDGFMINLIESVLIVIVVLLFAMGFRSGALISSGLVFTILGTFIVMKGMGIELQRVTLAAIIVAMGMLVDNAIVVADGILIDLKRGMPRSKAFVNTAMKTSMPLLGATIVAILAFMPLGFSPGSAGEFLKSLFYVLAISLFLSWVFAMIQTPYMANWFYSKKENDANAPQEELFNNALYRRFKKIIRVVLWHKTAFIIGTTIIFVISIWSFQFLRKEFFPSLDYNQFVVEYWLPQGSDLNQVEKDLDQLEKELSSWDDVQMVVTSLGRTPARYTLMRPMTSLNSNYGELIIDAEDYDASVEVGVKIEKYIAENYPQAETRTRTYSPIFGEYLIEAKFSGPNPQILRDLANQAKAIMRKSDKTQMVTDNWKNKVKVLNPVYSTDQATGLGISRSDMANSLAIASNGLPIGVFYEGNESMPIVLKMEESLGETIEQMESVPVWSRSQNSTPLAQIVDSIYVGWEDNAIKRFDGQRAIKAQCDPKLGYTAPMVIEDVKAKIDAIPLPDGYELEWLGDYKNSNKANKNLMALLPLALGLMVLIVILLFNNFKQPVIVMSVVPLALIGVVIGYLVTGVNFGFLGIIGTLGLIGMMIKNAIVLLDEINEELRNGAAPLEAIVNSTISRFRPVMMASLTTILGMAPLLFDVMFKSMAVSVMFGLLVGSVITLIVVPVMYAILYKVDTRSLHDE